jgi:hypothetical protein
LLQVAGQSSTGTDYAGIIDQFQLVAPSIILLEETLILILKSSDGYIVCKNFMPPQGETRYIFK